MLTSWKWQGFRTLYVEVYLQVRQTFLFLLLSFRTLYVEVYPDALKWILTKLMRFRTLYVEVYLSGVYHTSGSSFRFRTLYVEVYHELGNSIKNNIQFKVSVHYMLRFINDDAKLCDVRKASFRTLYVEVYLIR